MTFLPSTEFTTASTRLIDGLPTKSATNVFAGRAYTSSGGAYCCNFPFFRRQIFVASVIASNWSCVTYTNVAPVSWWSLFSSARISILSFASKLERGSSISRILGFVANVLAIATRCCCPPESSAGYRLGNSSILNSASNSFTLASILSFGHFRFSRPKAMFCHTVICGQSA